MLLQALTLIQLRLSSRSRRVGLRPLFLSHVAHWSANYCTALNLSHIRRQLHGLPSTVPVPSPDQRNTFRSRLATGLFISQAPAVESDKDVLRRIAALKELNAHCFRQERKAPRRRNSGRPLKTQDRSETAESEAVDWVFPSDSEWAKSDTSEPDYPDSEASESGSGCVPVVLPPLTCIHCLFDPGNKDRRWIASQLSRKDALRRHVHQKHFKYYEESNIPMKCPHEHCDGREFKTIDHYKNHAANVHKVFY